MRILMIIYYMVCVVLWVGLTNIVVRVVRPGFPAWLIQNPKYMIFLLGTDRLPNKPEKTLRRFYLFLYGGFTWLLAWSWWVMPALKVYFYKSTPTLQAFQIAYYSVMALYVLYAAVGFLAIARSIAIWFKEIYSPALKNQLAAEREAEKKDGQSS